MERRRFSAEFKRGAVKLVQQPGMSMAQAAASLGVHSSILRRWLRQFESGQFDATAGAPLKSAQTLEIEQLRRELSRVKMERDILKKAVGYFAKEPS